MRAIFISDLHLNEPDAVTAERFETFMQTAVPGADALYVLGDLLHVWLGDAMLSSNAYVQRIAAQFAAASAAGTKIYIARGNRDFMIGREFAAACGATLLDEQTVIDLDGRRVLLMHGDELCLDDVRYQRARRILRTDPFRIIGNALPTAMRNFIARTLRGKSEAHKATTAMNIMDANPDAALAAMDAHDAATLIHGHTHRPAHHRLPDGRERWVMTDWQQDYGYLEWSAGKFSVLPWHNKKSSGG
jgi:UDP-2,3-diacylglucosamine hydrolase